MPATLAPIPPRVALPKPAESVSRVSPQSDMWRRLCRNRFAVASIWLLAGLSVVAFAAEFFSPHAPDWSCRNYLYAPPQPLHFSWKQGFHVNSLRPQLDPVTRRWRYEVTQD